MPTTAGHVARAAAALVLPSRCAGCGRAGPAWCRECAAVARAPAPAPPRGTRVPVRSAAPLDAPLRRAVTAHKDGGRDDVRDVLARLLAAAVSRAVTEDPALRRARARGDTVVVVPVPTRPGARRRRGSDPVAALAAAAVALAGEGLVLAPVLRHRRGVADQSGLGRAARRANLAGALTVPARSRHVVAGRPCVLVDDVVTTGATLDEAARALSAAGAARVVAATAAATPGPS